MTLYRDFNELTDIQTRVMKSIISWAKVKKKPIPKKNILVAMKKQKVGMSTVTDCLNVLIQKGYIRKAYTIRQNTASYVQLRGL